MMIEARTGGRRIGLFGGSFNPPHICHTLATIWAMQTHRLDEVWWIPTYQHAFAKELIEYSERHAMCELATRQVAGVHVVDIERELGGESRTIDTVKALRARYSDDDFWLIVGADILHERHKWKDWSGLMQQVSLLVVGRVGYAIEGSDAQWTSQLALPDINSTAIREALDKGEYEQLRAWLSADVIDYIVARQHYVMR